MVVIEREIIDRIKHHSNWPLEDNVRNIEIGASINYFGKIEYPNCYLTDITDNDVPHFTEVENYEFGKCHFLDGIIDFNNFPNLNRKFDRVICCNPFLIGFRGKANAKEFILNAAKALKNDGEIRVLCNNQNQWARYRSAKKHINSIIEENKDLEFSITLSDLEVINEEHRYIKEYKYVQLSIHKNTVPNQYYSIKIEPNE